MDNNQATKILIEAKKILDRQKTLLQKLPQ